MTGAILEEALQRLIDGEISPAELAEVEQVLAKDEEARLLFLDFVKIHSVLDQRAHATPPLGKVVPMDRVISRQKRRTLRLAGFSAAAAIVALLALSIFILLPEPPAATFKVSPKTEYTLTHPASGKRAPEGKAVAVGSRLKVERGTVELMFVSGVRGIVRGPADFILEREDLVDLRSGIVWFEVPEEAVGFQVNTPDFLLTDLGTEFGIASRPKEDDQVHVFTGKVEVHRHDGLKKSLTISEGEAHITGPNGTWKEIDNAPELFVTNLPYTDPAPPYLYWSFNGFRGDTMPVRGTHPDTRKIASVRGFPDHGPSITDGQLGRAASFGETMDHIRTDWSGIGRREPRSVAFWLKLPDEARTQNYNSTLVSWGNPQYPNPNEGWALRATNLDTVLRPDTHEELHDRTVFQLWFGETWINGSTDLADGEWHHIAVCYDGEIDPRGLPDVDVYVDGKREPCHYHTTLAPGSVPAKLHTRTVGPLATPLLIGRSKGRPEVSCNATLDELYIFEGYLSYDLVYALAHATANWQP